MAILSPNKLDTTLPTSADWAGRSTSLRTNSSVPGPLRWPRHGNDVGHPFCTASISSRAIHKALISKRSPEPYQAFLFWLSDSLAHRILWTACSPLQLSSFSSLLLSHSPSILEAIIYQANTLARVFYSAIPDRSVQALVA